MQLSKGQTACHWKLASRFRNESAQWTQNSRNGTYTTIAHVYLQAQDPLILEDTSALQSWTANVLDLDTWEAVEEIVVSGPPATKFTESLPAKPCALLLLLPPLLFFGPKEKFLNIPVLAWIMRCCKEHKNNKSKTCQHGWDPPKNWANTSTYCALLQNKKILWGKL